MGDVHTSHETKQYRNHISFKVGYPARRSLNKGNTFVFMSDPNAAPIYGVVLGRDFKHCAIGIEGFYLNLEAEQPTKNDGSRIIGKFKSKGFLLNVSRDFIKNKHTFQIGIGAGITENSMPDTYSVGPSTDPDNLVAEGKTIRRMALSAFGGFSYQVTSRLSLGISARYLRLGQFQSQPDEFGAKSGDINIIDVGLNAKIKF